MTTTTKDPPTENAELPVGVKPICMDCKRPIAHFEEGWFHINSAIDQPAHPCFHFAEPWIEPPTPWGHLADRATGGLYR